MRVALVLVLCACGRIGFDAGGDGIGSSGGDGRVSDVFFARGDVVFTTNVAFVTKPDIMLGALGSLAAADDACRMEAEAASLPGTYVAWLSTSTTNAIDRISGSRGWVRADGLPFVDQVSDLAAGRLHSPLVVGADGAQIAVPAGVATGTGAAGTVALQTCGDLNSPTTTIDAGLPHTTSSRWTVIGYSWAQCNIGQRIYCFGTGATTPLVVPSVPSRRAFISTGWSVGGGLAAADAHCAADAMSACLANPASFRALIATTSASAAARFADGLPWARIDGVLVASTAQDLLAYNWQVPLTVDATGNHLTTPSASAWLGANTPALVGTNTCSDWTVSNNGATGTCPDYDELEPYTANCPCGSGLRLYCLEQ